MGELRDIARRAAREAHGDPQRAWGIASQGFWAALGKIDNVSLSALGDLYPERLPLLHEAVQEGLRAGDPDQAMFAEHLDPREHPTFREKLLKEVQQRLEAIVVQGMPGLPRRTGGNSMIAAIYARKSTREGRS